jgi:hypothetical protein
MTFTINKKPTVRAGKGYFASRIRVLFGFMHFGALFFQTCI